MSTKKINEILGISNIDTFLNDLDIKNPDGKSFSDIDQGINDNVQQIDNQILEYQKNGIANINVTNIESSLCEIKDLIDFDLCSGKANNFSRSFKEKIEWVRNFYNMNSFDKNAVKKQKKK